MANELRHGSVGLSLTQPEWESVTGHSFDAQAAGDTLYASSATQLSRLAIGTANQVLIVTGGLPAWSSTLTTPTFSGVGTGTWVARWSGGTAITAAQYEITRDADGTNQLHFNVPTGATYEWSVNDVAEMTLSATAVNFQDNSLTTTGGGSLTGTWTNLGTVTTVDINGGTLDGVTIGGASAAAVTGTVITGTQIIATTAAATMFDAQPSSASLVGGRMRNAGNGDAAWRLQAGGTGDPIYILSATDDATVMAMGLDNSASDGYVICQGQVPGTTDRLRLAATTGVLDVDGSSGLAAATVGQYDDYDDAMVLADWVRGATAQYRLHEGSPLNWASTRAKLVEMGVLIPKNQGDGRTDPGDPNGYFIRVQNVLHLLAGGIYQSRERFDREIADLRSQILALKAA